MILFIKYKKLLKFIFSYLKLRSAPRYYEILYFIYFNLAPFHHTLNHQTRKAIK